MSLISTASKKIHSSWKISDSSKLYPNEESIRDSNILLPQKFSPVKNQSNDSKFLTASKQKLKLVKNRKIFFPQQPNLTPRRRQISNLNSSNQFILKESYPSVQTPIKNTTDILSQKASKQSLVLQNIETQGPLAMAKEIGQINSNELKSKQQHDLKTIHQIKMDFINFKAQIWNQLIEQRQLITSIGINLAKKIEENQFKIDKQERQSVIAPIKNIASRQSADEITKQITHLSNKLEEKYLEIKTLNIQQGIVLVEVPPPVEDIIVDTNYHLSQDELKGQTPIPKEAQLDIRPQKIKTSLDKCNQIVQTIGILSEINSSPVNKKTKSIEKLSIEEYKQKLISISRSNQYLLKQPIRVQIAGEEQARVKGNFKLDKFYNAIEKLKEEVNEIRNINDMKQIKKLKIVKVNE